MRRIVLACAVLLIAVSMGLGLWPQGKESAVQSHDAATFERLKAAGYPLEMPVKRSNMTEEEIAAEEEWIAKATLPAVFDPPLPEGD